MFKKDSFISGLLIGIVFPAGSYLMTEVLELNHLFFEKENVWYMISAGLNLFLMRYLFQRNLSEIAYGIMFMTFFSALILIFIVRID